MNVVGGEVTYLVSAAISQHLHDGVNLTLKYLSQLGAVFVDPGRLAIVQPGVLQHQPHVIHVLPGVLVDACVQFVLDGGEVHGLPHDVEVVLEIDKQSKQHIHICYDEVRLKGSVCDAFQLGGTKFFSSFFPFVFEGKCLAAKISERVVFRFLIIGANCNIDTLPSTYLKSL